MIFIKNLDGSQTSVISKIIAVILCITYCVVFFWITVMICFYIYLHGRSLSAYQYKQSKNPANQKRNRIGSLNSQEAEASNKDPQDLRGRGKN